MKRRSPQHLGDLIEKCNRGNNRAWHTLLDLVAPVIFSQCGRSKLTRDESFDIFGQVSLQLIDSIKTLNSPERVFSFVATITRRKIYAFYQKIQVAEYLDDAFIAEISDETQKNPEELLEIIDRRELLLEAMSALPKRDYKLLWSLFFDPKEPSYKEIAKSVGIPVSSVGPVRARALAKLYEILKTKQFKL